MNYQRHEQRLFFSLVVCLLSVAGCAPEAVRPTRICPGKDSTANSIGIMQLYERSMRSFKGHGRCVRRYYDAKDKKHKKESFEVKLWVNPPAQIYLQGNMAFDAKALVLGSNEEEFWLWIKPEIKTYWRGRWDQQGDGEKLKIDPKIMLEGLGFIEIRAPQSWSLSNEGPFDVLTKRDGLAIKKKVYIYNCDYRVRKIEYFDNNQEVVVAAELYKYKQVSKDFSVPARIKIINLDDEKEVESFEITLKSIKAVEFNEKQKNYFFKWRQPKGFKHRFRIINGEALEEP